MVGWLMAEVRVSLKKVLGSKKAEKLQRARGRLTLRRAQTSV